MPFAARTRAGTTRYIPRATSTVPTTSVFFAQAVPGPGSVNRARWRQRFFRATESFVSLQVAPDSPRYGDPITTPRGFSPRVQAGALFCPRACLSSPTFVFITSGLLALGQSEVNTTSDQILISLPLDLFSSKLGYRRERESSCAAPRLGASSQSSVQFAPRFCSHPKAQRMFMHEP